MLAWIIRIYLCLISFCYALPNQVIIVRHAERYGDTGYLAGQLNPKGLRRAGALGSYLTLIDSSTTNATLFPNGPSTILFASRPVDIHANNTTRCIQTIATAANALGLPIHSGFTYGQEKELAEFILTSPSCDGKNVLICWHHPKIKDIVKALGYGFPYEPYPEDRYDLVWYMPYFPAPSPLETLTAILQELLYDDPNTLP